MAGVDVIQDADDESSTAKKNVAYRLCAELSYTRRLRFAITAVRSVCRSIVWPRRPQGCHQLGDRNSLARYIADCNGQACVRYGDEVVVIATDA